MDNNDQILYILIYLGLCVESYDSTIQLYRFDSISENDYR